MSLLYAYHNRETDQVMGFFTEEAAATFIADVQDAAKWEKVGAWPAAVVIEAEEGAPAPATEPKKPTKKPIRGN
jgi:hypothetical protein